MPETRANAIAAIPPTNAMERRRGTGFFGWSLLTRDVAQRHQRSAATIPRAGIGSICQSKRRLAAVGGSAGTGPWAAAGPAAASPTATPATAPTTRISARLVVDGLHISKRILRPSGETGADARRVRAPGMMAVGPTRAGLTAP